ncbi:putative serine protease K12H4.7 [Halenospora varia]|nr:putative serine protease K12H4.7 [Halenospora varia]
MVAKLRLLSALLALASATLAAEPMDTIERRVRRNTINSRDLLKRDNIDPKTLYPAYNLSVPIDHFHNDTMYEPHSNGTFPLRYWFDATYYKPGGPVIVLQSGETDGTGRLVFLQKGLLHQLAVETGGIGVVLEHRYYGTSIPTPDFTTESLRFLTTDQALADQAYFAQHVVFKGLEHVNLQAPNTPYLAYGGSYAGAFVAFLRKLYPDVYWGVISSSGVTEAIWDYWTYFEPIRVYGGEPCITYVQKITHMMDNILIKTNSSSTTAELKSAFGFPNITYNDDFAYAVASGVTAWQGRNWDPANNDPSFAEFCAAITNSTLKYSPSSNLTSTAKDLLTKGGYTNEIANLTTPLLNWIGWLNENTVASCKRSQDSCFGTHNITFYAQDDISADWRAWPYQYCTQWGYLQTGSGVPSTQLPLISRTNDLEYESLVCRAAFNITTPANVTAINKYGGFGISYPRLAIVDGEQDPWRPACPHASPFNSTATNRTSTLSEPFILIEGAVHHWDENGLFANETVNTPGEELPPLPEGIVQDRMKRNSVKF